jgi:hypothetical protein
MIGVSASAARCALGLGVVFEMIDAFVREECPSDARRACSGSCFAPLAAAADRAVAFLIVIFNVPDFVRQKLTR